MVAMRKVAALLGLLVIASMSSGVAQAQFGLVTCSATAVPPVVRAEGIAELVGDIVLVCIANDAPVSQSFFDVNVSVSLNVNVTNNINFGGNGSNVTDAVLIMDENNCVDPTPLGAQFGTCGAVNPFVQDPQFGTLAADNRLEWNQVRFPYPGAQIPGEAPGTFYPFPTTLRISSVRANASQLGVPNAATFPSTQVTAFLSITGPTTIAITNNVLNVAVPILGLITSTVPANINGLQCIDTRAAVAGYPPARGLRHGVQDAGRADVPDRTDSVGVRLLGARLEQQMAAPRRARDSSSGSSIFRRVFRSACRRPSTTTVRLRPRTQPTATLFVSSG